MDALLMRKLTCQRDGTSLGGHDNAAKPLASIASESAMGFGRGDGRRPAASRPAVGRDADRPLS